MPRPSRPWFRFYVEAVYDRKLRRLTPAERWLWVVVLAAARQSPIAGYLMVSVRQPADEEDLADMAGLSVGAVQKGLSKMLEAGMLDTDDTLDAFFVPAWNDRQFESDDVTARVQRSRKRRSNVSSSDVATPPETETYTDTTPPTPSSLTLAVDNDAEDYTFGEQKRSAAEWREGCDDAIRANSRATL